ncbi:hypothetical protein HGRIS_000384 [Hohenbuehelia grisea]|uniref:F-box domain-containing protein n=1 Tax=Hohenbuehelia grisea TaxID=104357 RepID=A0ABR3JSW4_9AGAR
MSDESLMEQYTNQTSVDCDILKYREIVRKLYSRRNEFSAVSRLPSETLSTIFEMLAEDASKQRPIGGDGKWLTVAGVCSRWREVVRGCPYLWVYFRCWECPEWATEKLRLSKAALWSRDAPQSLSIDALNMLLEHPERIVNLTLNLVDITTYSKPLGLVAPLLVKMQRLRVLSLSPSPFASTFPLPDDFATYNPPRLRHITLSGIQFAWGSPWICNLTELIISSFPGDSLRPILHALTNTTRLELLDLFMFIQRPTSNFIADDLHPLPQPNLPHLKTLSIMQDHHDALSALNFLAHITCPKLSSLTFDYSNTPLQPLIIIDHLINHASVVLKNYGTTIKAEVKNTYSSFGLILEPNSGSRREIASLAVPPKLDIRLTLASASRESRIFIRDLTYRFLQRLRLGMLQELSVIQPRPFGNKSFGELLSLDHWSRILAGCPILERLDVNLSVGVIEA